MPRTLSITFTILCLVFIMSPICFGQTNAVNSQRLKGFQRMPEYKKYIDFFLEVYKVMNENYYHDVSVENFKKFVYVFNTRLFPRFKLAGSSSKYIKWRSAAYLVDALKAEDDIFSAFYPPKEAKEYEETALGKKIDLGITGQLTEAGFVVSRLEPRGDAYEKGLRELDTILKIGRKRVTSLDEATIMEMLTPLEGTKVRLQFLQAQTGRKKTIKVLSKEYFKKFVFEIPTNYPQVRCIQIERFNRMTSTDFEGYMKDVLGNNIKNLIIDLRGNPGGPPLAAREISAFFLTPKEEFAYFQKRGRPKASLDVPSIPEIFHYKGRIAILMDQGSGSASELFAGVLQGQKRAILIGTNSAGQVFLKSMFNFDDDSMLLLVTARGFQPDGTIFTFDGLAPDQPAEKKGLDLVDFAAKYLVSLEDEDEDE